MAQPNQNIQNVIRRLLAANQGRARLARNLPAQPPIEVPVAASSNGVARLRSPEESTTYRLPTSSNSSKGGKRKTRKSKRRSSKKSRRVNRK